MKSIGSFRVLMLCLAALMVQLPAGKAGAQVYKWVDGDGKVHFSNAPPAETEQMQNGTATAPPPAGERDAGKLYDLREKAVEALAVDRIRLASGKVVKYIGVADPSDFLLKNGRPEGIEKAVGFHEQLVKGKIVTVLLGEKRRDRNGDYLGHVFIGQEIFVNADLIRTGHALTEEFPSDFEYQSLFLRLYRDAQEKRLGIWGR